MSRYSSGPTVSGERAWYWWEHSWETSQKPMPSVAQGHRHARCAHAPSPACVTQTRFPCEMVPRSARLCTERLMAAEGRWHSAVCAWCVKNKTLCCCDDADTVRTHLYVHIRRANQFQEIIHVIKINTHKSIHNTWYLHTQYKHEFCVCILYVLASMLVFTCILLVYTSTKHTNKSKIHTNTY